MGKFSSNGKVRGFTLIELLVVIAILAVLAVAVVLVLNPAELIKEGRDTTRISDLATLNSAIALWTADVLNPTVVGTVTGNAGSKWPGSGGLCFTTSSTTPNGGGGSPASCTATTTTTVAGSGWLPIDFTAIASGAPLSREPIDPNNGGTCKPSNTCQYLFYASSTVGVYKLEAMMESAKFYAGGSSDVVSNSKDGGIYATVYETGSNVSVAD